jgi:predicted porin
MKKYLFAATVLSLCAAAVSVPVHAQSPGSAITVYGVLDTYVGAIRSGGVSAYGLESGGLQVSRWGIRGSEDLGGGNAANFVLENGFNIDTGTLSVANTIFNRQAWVGVSNAAWGEVRFGQQNSVMFNMLGNIAAFYGGTFAAGLGTQSGYNFRNGNDISYASPRFNGWKAEAHYALGEDPAAKANGSVWQTALEYRGGRAYFLAAYLENRPRVAAPAPYLGVKDKQTAIGGSYEFAPVTIFLGYFKNKQTDNSIDKDLYSLSARYKFDDANELNAGWTYIKTKADNANVDRTRFTGSGHANHLALMYLHRLSKRTTIYSALANIANSDGLRYAMGAAQAPSGALLNRPLAGDSTTGFQVGVRHVF